MDIKMVQKLISIVFLIQFGALKVYSQVEKINQYNENDKKHGYWSTYLNKYFKEVNKDKAAYSFLTYYHNGKKIIGKIPKWIKSCELEVKGISAKSGETVTLDGTYIFTQPKKEGWSFVLKFKNGILLYNRYNWKDTNEDYEEYNYEKKYNGIEASYYAIGRSGNRILKGYYYVKGNQLKNNIQKIKLDN